MGDIVVHILFGIGIGERLPEGGDAQIAYRLQLRVFGNGNLAHVQFLSTGAVRHLNIHDTPELRNRRTIVY